MAQDLTKRTYPYQERGAKHSWRNDSKYRSTEGEQTCRYKAQKEGQSVGRAWAQGG